MVDNFDAAAGPLHGTVERADKNDDATVGHGASWD